MQQPLIVDVVYATTWLLQHGLQPRCWPESRPPCSADDAGPTFYLVEPGHYPPRWGDDTDWLEIPVRLDELERRAKDLLSRSAAAQGGLRLADSGWLVGAAGSVHLPPTEERLVRRLLRTPGKVVTREELAASAWPDERPTASAVDHRIRDARERLRQVGVTLHILRGKGVLLDLPGRAPVAARQAAAV